MARRNDLDQPGSLPSRRGRGSVERRPVGRGGTRLPQRLVLLHEDDDLLVVDKPPGLLTANVPSEDRPAVVNLLREHLRNRRKGGPRLGVIHRLDKEASGLLVFSKSDRAYEWLKEDFRARRVQRLYLAVAEGMMPGGGSTHGTALIDLSLDTDGGEAAAADADWRTIQSFLVETREGRVKSVAPGSRLSSGPAGEDEADHPGEPRLAVTHYRVLKAEQGRSLLLVRLATGRKHQIRAHLSEAGHPIVGDRAYGARTDPFKRLALHATALGFAHPGSGQAMRFASPAPASFYRSVGAVPPPTSPPAALDARTNQDLPAKGSDHEAVRTPERRRATDETPSNHDGRGVARMTAIQGNAPSTSWDHVASWYDALIQGERGDAGARTLHEEQRAHLGSDHYERVILPGTLRLLRPRPGLRVLDVACGQGVLARELAASGAEVVGLDASPRLVEMARRRGVPRRDEAGIVPGRVDYVVGDARDPRAALEAAGTNASAVGSDEASTTAFDAAACIMALMNIDPLEPVLRGCASLLKPGSVFVAVVLHPAFRAPGQTSWGWERPAERGKSTGGRGQKEFAGWGPGRAASSRQRAPRGVGGSRQGAVGDWRQYRRVDGYLSHGQREIVMNPGEAAHGKPPMITWTFHRPIQAYVKALSDAGFLIEALEEWPSLRRSDSGPRAVEENRARREIPMFLAWRAIRAR